MTRLRDWDFRPVMWGVVSGDWTCPGVDTVVLRTLEQAWAGSLVVLHDGRSGGRGVARVADALIPALRELGFCFASVDALWRGGNSRDREQPDM